MSEINKIINGIRAKSTECINSQLSEMALRAQDLKDNEKLHLTVKVLVTKEAGVYTMDGISTVKKEISTKVEIDTTTIDPDQPDLFDDSDKNRTTDDELDVTIAPMPKGGVCESKLAFKK